MKGCINTLLLLLTTSIAFSQGSITDFAEIDRRVQSIEPAPAFLLTQNLVANYTSDREKTRAIFSWIAQHIAYRAKNTRRTASRLGLRFAVEEAVDTVSWKTANDVVAEAVLKNQSAVCDGYTRLFKTLCNYAGIPAVIISGYARADVGRSGIKFKCNHNWNAVYIDSAWHLLDVTWSSGYMSYFGDEFIKHYNDRYFFTAPEVFIEDHFPDDLQWTLLSNPPVFREFEHAPYRQRSFIKYNITSYLPATGIINAAVGDTIHIKLETSNAIADKRVAADTICFSNEMEAAYHTVAFLQPAAGEKNIDYTYVVKPGNIEWLQLVYNKDIILQYRVKIKK